MQLYDKYISAIADTFAWVLMPNYFHFVVRIMEVAEMTVTNPDSGILKPPHQHFSNLFNAHSKAFNERFNRNGSLFERLFKRKLVEDSQYLKQLILYVHNNPVHHGFCSHTIEYPWSSYIKCISLKQTKLKRNEVIGWFRDKEEFIRAHDQEFNFSEIDNWLEINVSEVSY